MIDAKYESWSTSAIRGTERMSVGGRSGVVLFALVIWKPYALGFAIQGTGKTLAGRNPPLKKFCELRKRNLTGKKYLMSCQR